MAELHREGSAPAACAAGLFPCYLTLKILQNLFHALLNNPIDTKNRLPREKPKAVKDGGVKGR